MKGWIDALCYIAIEAGEAIKPFYKQGQDKLNVRKKSDASPVTEADLLSNQIICQGLTALAANVPIISEETQLVDFPIRQHWQRLWLVDPLDGTKGFIAGIPEFSVNIALIENHAPVLAVIYSPMDDALYFASKGGGSYKKVGQAKAMPIRSSSINWQQYTLALGKYHNEDRIRQILGASDKYDFLHLNSSLKFCALAEGEADIYLRFGPTGEWDTAAGQCILAEAGGAVVDFNGSAMHYNARESIINEPFIAVGDCQAIDKTLELIKRSPTS
jgi:3'(2'), 5'-bisphosphate nucleotidase